MLRRALAPFFVLLTASRAAAAPEPVGWWVDPSACPAWAAPLTNQLALACEASNGACTTSTTPAPPARRLALHCLDEARWILSAGTTNGTVDWTLELHGGPDERLRAAAVAVARMSASPSATPPRPSPSPVEPPAHEESPARGGFAVAGRFVWAPAPPRRRRPHLSYGVALRAIDSGELMAWLSRSIQPYLGLSFDISALRHTQEVQTFRFGGGFLWRVPHTADMLGLSVEGGLAVSNGEILASDTSVDEQRTLGYSEAGVLLQAPVGWPIRPFISVFGGVLGPSAYTGPFLAGTALGCQVSLW